jgi:hypothetical protein
MTNLLNRRAVVRAIPFIGAAAFAPVIMARELQAVPAKAAEAPASLAVSPEIAAAAKAWQHAIKVKDEALDAYSGPNAPKYSLPIDHPLRSAWIDADDAVFKAQWKLLNLITAAISA